MGAGTKLLKLLHLASMAAFVGGLLAAIVAAQATPYATSDAMAVQQRAIAAVVAQVVVPSVLAQFLSGALLMVSRPAYFGARWVWVKALPWLALAGIALMVVQPATDAMSAVAQFGAQGTPALHRPIDPTAAGQWGALACLALALAAAALAVWRPRLGRAADGD